MAVRCSVAQGFLFAVLLIEVLLFKGFLFEVLFFEVFLFDVLSIEVSLFKVFLFEVLSIEVSLFKVFLFEVLLFCGFCLCFLSEPTTVLLPTSGHKSPLANICNLT